MKKPILIAFEPGWETDTSKLRVFWSMSEASRHYHKDGKATTGLRIARKKAIKKGAKYWMYKGVRFEERERIKS